MRTIEFMDWYENTLKNVELPVESRLTIYMENGAIISVDRVELDDDGDVAFFEGDAL